MAGINILFPHQLFEDHPIHHNGLPIYLVEEFLFFKEFKFHKTKLAYHRASMKVHASTLEKKGTEVRYIDSKDPQSDIRNLLPQLAKDGVRAIHYIDPTDNWLERRIKTTAKAQGVDLKEYENPLFLNSRTEIRSFFTQKKFYFQTAFYKDQRKKRNILIDAGGDPLGGQWSFDSENRKKYPSGKMPPSLLFPESDQYWGEAISYVKLHYPNNPGKLQDRPLYPYRREDAQTWFQNFLEYRFHEFGPYEDAIVQRESYLHHSVLSPLINVGLLSPQEVIDGAIEYGLSESVPINSIEGFVRQIIGWREFVRGIYQYHGSAERNRNFWNFKRRIPSSFYDGSTGIDPVDQVIQKTLDTAYAHHIERLMILGNFMLLCQFDPDEVYRWFMELFIDAYDWVMVPNVYGMSQFTDGGLFATKPYISGSNYVLKMSDHSKGQWADIWNALFWNFIDQHQEVFRSNHRMSMMYHSWKRQSAEKKSAILDTAGTYLAGLDN